MHRYFDVIKKYAVFEGRASRSEYWYFILFNFLISLTLFLAWVLTKYIVFDILYVLYTFAILLPVIGVSIRRLHDTGRKGWWLLIDLIPFIGSIVLLFFFVQDSNVGTNQYGPDPKFPPTHGG